MSVSRTHTLANENANAALENARKDRTQPVLIAGGGIGGLAAAVALARRGIASHVLERRADFHEEGAGIQIGPNGTRILRLLGVADALRPHVAVPESIRVRDGTTGDELACLPLGRWIAARHGAPYWVAHRSDLHNALLRAARAEPLVALSLGFDVAEIATDGQMVAVTSTDGRAWTGKALIAADGVWSTLRSLHFDPRAPRFFGKSAARTVLAAGAVPDTLRNMETNVWLFPGAHVVHYPVANGRELALVAIVNDTHNDKAWSAPIPDNWVQQRVPPCTQPLHDLLENAQTWKRWALHTLPVPRTWSRGPVALLGDAAHPVLPFLAQGGVLALEDAAVLADALHRFDTDVTGALAWYGRQRRDRAAHVAAASRQNGRIFHLSGPLAQARNLALRSISPQRLMARYDWLYGWRADKPAG
jgi:salicylate hydroxylase